jgi:hypothetical protein
MCTFYSESQKGRNHSEDLGVAGRIILKLILGEGLRVWIGFVWLRIQIVTHSCEHGNKGFGKRRGIS